MLRPERILCCRSLSPVAKFHSAPLGRTREHSLSIGREPFWINHSVFSPTDAADFGELAYVFYRTIDR